MYKHFSAEFFAGNRQKLRSLFTGTAPIVLTANGLLQRNNDVTYGFRQDSSFWYLTGIEEPDVLLVLDREREFLILPERNQTQDIFEGQIDPTAMARTSGISTILDHQEGWRVLSKRLTKAKHMATLAAPPVYNEHWGFYSNPTKALLLGRIREINPGIKLLDLGTQLSRQRLIKQPPELAAIQEAIKLTSQTIKRIQRRTYQFEYQVEADILAEFKRHDSRPAFASIVASGQRACAMHNTDNSGKLGVKDLLVLDIGAEVENYAADITRCYSLSKKPSKRQKDIYAAVLAVQEYAMGLVKPGALLKDNEALVEQYMGEKLRELGLIKTISRDNVRAFFPHATSHFMGLDVHDVGDYSLPLAAGMVLTVEPGIYISKESTGVRIEDDVLVTAEGYQVLSGSLPRRLA